MTWRGWRATVVPGDDVAPALEGLAADVPLVSRDADAWFRVHHLWEDAVERIFPDHDRTAMRMRALELFQRRGDTLRMGWSALRWGDDAALASACRRLVHHTAGALPLDTATRWLAGASETARATPDLRLLDVALRHAGDFDDPRLDSDLDDVVDAYLAGGDHNGAVVALVLGMAMAHMRGDLTRLLGLDERAQSLSGADE